MEGSDSSSQSDYYRWYVLVNPAELGLADPEDVRAKAEHAARATMGTYRMWAAGEFCGYVTLDPAGNEVDACWGFDDEDYALEQGKDAAMHDAGQRTDQANLVGAGFVGLL